MKPGQAAVCEGRITHRRLTPQTHEFTYAVSQVWLDPDDPGALCGLHPAWSHTGPAPIRFKRSDYGNDHSGSLSDAARDDLTAVIGHRPIGPVRMVSQLRRWGWLFNPITLFLVWDHPQEGIPGAQNPIGAVIEVTNTPWKEKYRYALSLQHEGNHLIAEFDKALHVSPLLGMDYKYLFRLKDTDRLVVMDIDVIDRQGSIILETRLRLHRREATRQLLSRSLRIRPLATLQVSAGIHSQALRLWAKRVPFIRHPRKRKQPLVTSTSDSETHEPS